MIGSGPAVCPPGGSTFSTVPSLEPRNRTVVFLWGPAMPSTATCVSRALGDRLQVRTVCLVKLEHLKEMLRYPAPHCHSFTSPAPMPMANVVYLADPTRQRREWLRAEVVLTCWSA